jgi:hypothetical protein
MNTLKMMFGGGADVAQLAEMIRRFGRGEDKILAHITPEEAAMLKDSGGRGTVNPMTGLPEFQRDYDFDLGSYDDIRASGPNVSDYEFEAYGPTADRTPSAAMQEAPFFSYGDTYRGMDQDRSFLPPDAIRDIEIAEQQAGEQPSAVGGRQIEPVEENIFARAERGLQDLRGTLDRYPALTRIGAGGANLLAQGLLAQRANRGREAEAARLRGRAQPFRAAEAEAMGRATGEGLTPQQAREFEIAQARARQGLSAQNLGAGSAAAGILAGQATRARSVARQESLDRALELANIADQYERQAIQQELARDKELAALFGDVISREIQAASRTQAPQGRG